MKKLLTVGNGDIMTRILVYTEENNITLLASKPYDYGTLRGYIECRNSGTISPQFYIRERNGLIMRGLEKKKFVIEVDGYYMWR